MVLWFFFVIGTATLARFFPPVTTDEVFIGVYGHNLLSGKGGRYSLYDDIFAPSVYAYRDAFVQGEETLYNGWVGLWLKISRNYWAGRFASLSAGWLAILTFYAIGRRMGNIRLGIGIGFLLMVDPIFISASSVVRPETLLLFCSAVILWLMIRLRSDFPLKGFIVGFLSGLQIAVHLNALAVLPGIWIFAAALEAPEHRRSFIVTMILGSGSGIVGALLMTNLHSLWLAHETFVSQMSRPPIFSPPHTLAGLARLITSKMTTTETSVPADSRGYWRHALLLHGVGLGLNFAGGCLSWLTERELEQDGNRFRKTFFYGLLVSFGASVALIARPALLYQLNLYPFLLPFLGLYWINENTLYRKIHAAIKFLSGFMFCWGLVFFALYLGQYKRHNVSFSTIEAQLTALVPDRELKVVGPNLFWYWSPEDRFRDLGALTYSHWYSGGQRDVSGWLGQWEPDILIIDSTFKAVFLGPGPVGPRLAHMLQVPVRYLGTIDGKESYGTFEVYAVRWPTLKAAFGRSIQSNPSY